LGTILEETERDFRPKCRHVNSLGSKSSKQTTSRRMVSTIRGKNKREKIAEYTMVGQQLLLIAIFQSLLKVLNQGSVE
jgi:hypothetical protein